MNTFDLIEKTADINSDLLEEAAMLKRKPHKGLKITVVLCCVIIALGVTAHATGMFNNVFSHREYNSNEHEYINKIEVQGYVIETELPIVVPAEIKGDVRSIKTEEGTGGVYGLKKEDLPGYIGYGPFDGIWFPYDKYETFVSVEEESPEDGIKTIKVVSLQHRKAAGCLLYLLHTALILPDRYVPVLPALRPPPFYFV